MVELNNVGPDDWKAWRELRLAALEEAPFAFGSQLADWINAPEERWRERLSVPDAYQVIASIDGTPAGMAGSFIGEAPQTAELVSMWVAPAGRGKGVGNALMTAIEDWARGVGAATLELSVVPGNDPAHNLYLRHGYVDTDELGDLMPDGVRREIVMRKAL
ncbi:ribosomal protein S18 acetylase RimI-like enzyme [Kribbella sp. VKM Ac-2569]|uniref:GNAT family N-acetyltransferase n=1 Tax=Kribbella sp. VKM Ac-2569 TaxID=2512220 RepID=UPI00102B6083|nr:GNAT family N-acetyltransferase [Kribbella sp. VKM Ac-2569]RZT20781.1 ribosomal protein S18 acetylase RimI-like enzyme [Kribbella sp. VKM Ac-2569]